MEGYFIAGTDTGVGKSRFSASLLRTFNAQGYRAVGMKPVASGAIQVHGDWVWEDVETLAQASNVMAPLVQCNPYRFVPAIAPHIAAQQVHVRIELANITDAYLVLAAQAEKVVVEGAGGWMTPLNETETLADWVCALQLPVILVVGIRLGCINHALLTARAISAQGLPLLAWVANVIDPHMLAIEENIATLQHKLSAPLLGIMGWQTEMAYNITVLDQIRVS